MYIPHFYICTLLTGLVGVNSDDFLNLVLSMTLGALTVNEVELCI